VWIILRVVIETGPRERSMTDDRAPWYSESISTRHLALDASKIVVTLDRLYTRLSERFPRSGLTLVCGNLAKVARRTAERARRLARPYKSLRLAVWVFAIAGLAAQISAALFLRINRLDTEAGSLIQGLEAAVNLLILFGAAVWFLMSLRSYSARAATSATRWVGQRSARISRRQPSRVVAARIPSPP
jgi:hypothetical protein